MTREEVYGDIESRAISQRFFRCLLNRLNEVSEETANEFLDSFADCKDIMNAIMLMEEGDFPAIF